MPKIEKLFTLEISPDKFVRACSDIELQELSIELDREMRSRKIVADLEEQKFITDEDF